MLWTAARGFQGVDMLTAATLTARYARLALESGDALHASRALYSEAWFVGAVGGAAVKTRTDELFDRAEALAVTAGFC